MNKLTMTVGVNFIYDGTSTTVAADTRNGPVSYNTGVLHPSFTATATAATDITVNDSTNSFPSTGTMAGDVLTVNIPGGLTAGPCAFTATLIY